jgi:hypothetical protein
MDKEEKSYDPSLNVKELLINAINRIDDLSKAESKRIDEKFRDSDIKYQIQFTSAKEAVSIASIAQEKLVAQALDGTKEEISKADLNTDKRFSLLSEKIDGITTQMNKSSGERGIYVTHSDLENAMDKLQNSIEATLRPVVNFMNSQTGQSKAQNQIWGYMFGGLMLIIAILTYFSAHPIVSQIAR